MTKVFLLFLPVKVPDCPGCFRGRQLERGWLCAVLAIFPLAVGMAVECLLEVTRNGDGRRDDVPFFVDF